MRRVLETIFRHPLQLVVLLLAPTLIGTVVVLLQPRLYEASAMLWALQRYSIIGATGAEADLSATPSSTQATALTELLQTRSFALAVASKTDLKSTMDAAARSNTDTLNDALFSEISKNVKVTPVGYNLYQITYDNKNPAVAQQVVTAVVQNFGSAATSFSTVEGQQLLAIYSGQLTQAQVAATNAVQSAAEYLSRHPNASTAKDPVYTQLYNQAQADQATVLSLQGKIAAVNQQLATIGSGSSQLYSIIDAPSVNDRPISRVKTVSLGAGIGLAVALLACTIYLVMLLRQDRAIYGPADLRRSTPLPVLLELPYLPSARQTYAVNARGASRNGRRTRN
jgi:uncharacterized protein involved in exopolysaccharide biosynthesis